MLYLTPCKQKLVDSVFQNQRLNFLKKCDFVDEVWRKMAKKIISEEKLRTDCGMNNRPMFSPKVSKEA